MKIAIAGATGHVGARAATRLAEAGAQVVALVRHPEKVPTSPRVRVEQGTLDDGAYVARATRGADALLWLTPTHLTAPDLHAYTLALATNAVAAIRENEIPRVVFVSSHGADRAHVGHVSFAGEVERLLEAAAPHTRVLRSAGFMQNLVGSLAALRTGMLFGTLPADKSYPLVSARDVGDMAARWLLDPAWTGHGVHGVHGPADLCANDITAILSRVLDTQIRYQRVPPDTLRATMLQRGASASVAEAYVTMFGAFADPEYRPAEPRTKETSTATTLESFALDVLTRL